MIYTIDAAQDTGENKTLYPCIFSRIQECQLRRYKNPKSVEEAMENKKLTQLMKAYQSKEINCRYGLNDSVVKAFFEDNGIS